jgi:hypothetical protein
MALEMPDPRCDNERRVRAWKEITMTQDAGLQEAEYAYERISAGRDTLIRKGFCVHGWLQENGDGTQTCLAGCGHTFPDFETAMNAEPLRFEESEPLIIAAEARGSARGEIHARPEPRRPQPPELAGASRGAPPAGW